MSLMENFFSLLLLTLCQDKLEWLITTKFVWLDRYLNEVMEPTSVEQLIFPTSKKLYNIHTKYTTKKLN
jgi:hypothetical protein